MSLTALSPVGSAVDLNELFQPLFEWSQRWAANTYPAIHSMARSAEGLAPMTIINRHEIVSRKSSNSDDSLIIHNGCIG